MGSTIVPREGIERKKKNIEKGRWKDKKLIKALVHRTKTLSPSPEKKANQTDTRGDGTYSKKKKMGSINWKDQPAGRRTRGCLETSQ